MSWSEVLKVAEVLVAAVVVAAALTVSVWLSSLDGSKLAVPL